MMISRMWHRDRLVWSGLLWVLPLLYFSQIMPHMHVCHEAPSSRAIPESHSHHTHDHDAHPADCRNDSHRHVVARHVDDHTPGSGPQGPANDLDCPGEAVPSGPDEHESSSRHLVAALDERPPLPPALACCDPRGPPNTA